MVLCLCTREANCWLVVAGRTGVQRGPSFRFLHSVMSDVCESRPCIELRLRGRPLLLACLLAWRPSEHCSSAVRQLYTLRGFGMLLRLRKRKTAMPPSICDSDPRGPGTMRARCVERHKENEARIAFASTSHFVLALDARRSLLQLATNPLQSIFAVTLLCTLVLHRLWCAYTRMDKAQ